MYECRAYSKLHCHRQRPTRYNHLGVLSLAHSSWKLVPRGIEHGNGWIFSIHFPLGWFLEGAYWDTKLWLPLSVSWISQPRLSLLLRVFCSWYLQRSRLCLHVGRALRFALACPRLKGVKKWSLNWHLWDWYTPQSESICLPHSTQKWRTTSRFVWRSSENICHSWVWVFSWSTLLGHSNARCSSWAPRFL